MGAAESEVARPATLADLGFSERDKPPVNDDMARDVSGNPSAATELRDETAEVLAKRLDESERSRERLELAYSTLSHRLAVSEWKLASLEQRRWMRLGTVLNEAWRRPLTIPVLPVRLWRALRSKDEPLPRPVAPGELGADDSWVDRTDPSEGSVVSARDITALAMLGNELRELLEYEMRVVDLQTDRWRSQLEEEDPALLMLDSNAIALMGGADLGELLSACRAEDVKSVMWETSPDVVAAATKAMFDVICADHKASLSSYEGRLVERRGWVQPRIHNPIGGHRRPKDSAEVDAVNGNLAGNEYATTFALTREAKRYKVLRAGAEQYNEAIAPIVATATPVIVMDPSAGLGLHAESEENAYALEQSLVRSGVLRARLTHLLMREVMRNWSVASDVTAVLGQPDSARWPRIDVMVPTKRLHLVPRILDNLARQTYPNLHLFLVAHGVHIDREEVQGSADRVGVELASVVEVDESVVLGDVFNVGFGETESPVVAKMDDDDFYGAEYLWDLYTALEFSGADVAGKWAHYAYLEGVDSLVYRFKDYEHRFRDIVAISTLLMRREVLDVSRFPAMPWGSGSVFLRELGAEGARVFAADRWNYIYARTTDGSRNTFPSKDLEILAESDVICRGMNIDEVVV